MQALRTVRWLVLLAAVTAGTAYAQSTSSPPAEATAPPSAAPHRSQADLEKLVAPIALYPDPLLATLLPASAYPLEIVQAARFVKDTNNIAKLDSQPWDDNVKALARFPDVIAKMDANIAWTSDLGQAFIADQKSVMDAIQAMRNKAYQAGTLKTSPQQNVVTTNEVVQKTIEQQVVYVTNTVVQIQPAQPQVIYVPQYNPAYVYAPPPAYAYNPVAPLVTFGVGMAVGAAIANDCDWHGGGVYVGHHGVGVWGGGHAHGDVDVDVNRTVNQNVNVNRSANVNQTANASRANGQKWQPDPNRRAATSPAATPQARGWGSQTSAGASTAGAQGAAVVRGQGATAARAQGGSAAGAQGGSADRAQAASAGRAQGGSTARAQRASGVSPSASSRGAGGGSAFNSSGGASQARMASARGSASRGSFRGGGGGGRRR